MPFVRISLRQGTSPQYSKSIGEAVHKAMVEALTVPADDHFQVITEHSPEGLTYDPQYLGVHRTDSIVFIQITLSEDRNRSRSENSTNALPNSSLNLPDFFHRTCSSISSKLPGRIGLSAMATPTIWTLEQERFSFAKGSHALNSQNASL